MHWSQHTASTFGIRTGISRKTAFHQMNTWRIWPKKEMVKNCKILLLCEKRIWLYSLDETGWKRALAKSTGLHIGRYRIIIPTEKVSLAADSSFAENSRAYCPSEMYNCLSWAVLKTSTIYFCLERPANGADGPNTEPRLGFA